MENLHPSSHQTLGPPLPFSSLSERTFLAGHSTGNDRKYVNDEVLLSLIQEIGQEEGAVVQSGTADMLSMAHDLQSIRPHPEEVVAELQKTRFADINFSIKAVDPQNEQEMRRFFALVDSANDVERVKQFGPSEDFVARMIAYDGKRWMHFMGLVEDETVATVSLSDTCSRSLQLEGITKLNTPETADRLTAAIHHVATHPSHQRKGFASAMMEFAMATAKKLGMERVVLQADPPGVPLYRKFRFQEVGKINVCCYKSSQGT